MSPRRTGWLRRLWRGREQQCLSAHEFEAIFDLEFIRSERSGHPLSLVVFAPRRDDDGHLEPVLSAVALRKRQYDTVGGLEARRIGVLLPYTGVTGAWSFADDVMQRLGPVAASVSAIVSSNEDDGSGTLSPGEVSPRKRAGIASEGVEVEHGAASATRTTARELPTSARRRGEARRSTDIWDHFERRPAPWKRTLDIVGSASAILVLSPLLVVIAAAIKLTSPGPILFRQQRAGQFGRPFTLLKFRSMNVDAEGQRNRLLHLNEMDGPVFKIRNDPRITPIGRWLRRWSLDELPQFFNVLRGDMSLVGPRPPTLDELPGYQRWHRRRLTRRGGLTCIWQTSGRNQIAFQEWMRMDMRYLRRESVWTDLSLLLKTVWTVASGRGAS